MLNEPYRLDITPQANEVWVCVQTTSLVNYKVVIATSGGAVPSFEPDLTNPHPGCYGEPTSPGSASSLCQTAGGTKTRLLNAEVGGSRVWLYSLQESPTKTDICVRSATANTGMRLTLDANGGQSVVSAPASNLGECTFQIIDDNGPPPFSIYTSQAGANPVAACVKVGTSYQSVRMNANGGQTIVTQASD